MLKFPQMEKETAITSHSLQQNVDYAQHLVHFYKSSQALAEAVCNYVVPGITRGDGIILIAQNKNLKHFQDLLENRAIDVTKARAFGQIMLIDAQEMMAKFMKNGLPQDEDFFSTVSPILENMSQRFPVVRVYGEMVDILLDHKNFAAVIKLEQLWNELSHKYKFSLLCGYANQTDERIIREICHAHTHCLSSDGNTTSL